MVLPAGLAVQRPGLTWGQQTLLRCRATEVSAREGVCPSLAGASKLNAPRFALYHRWPCEAHAQASHQSFSRVASPLPMPPAISTRRLGRISCKSLEPPLGSAIAFRRSGELPASLLQVSGTPSLEPPLWNPLSEGEAIFPAGTWWLHRFAGAKCAHVGATAPPS